MSQHTRPIRRSRKGLTEAERTERRQADRDRLEQAAKALLTSDGWRRWVEVRGRNGLARYSFGNQLLIAMQRPDATYIAGYRAFLELNRCVRKGERAIRILAPMSIKHHEAEGSATAEQDDRTRMIFRAVPVFDVSQTEPLPGKEPVPLEVSCQPIEGDSHLHLLPALEGLASELGYTVSTRRVDGPAEGWCDARNREIVIDCGLSGNAQVRVLVPWRSGRIRSGGMRRRGACSRVGSTCGVAEPVGRSGAARRRCVSLGPQRSSQGVRCSRSGLLSRLAGRDASHPRPASLPATARHQLTVQSRKGAAVPRTLRARRCARALPSRVLGAKPRGSV